MAKCCGRTFKNGAALAAHQSSPLHAQRAGAGPRTQVARKNPRKGLNRPASNEIVNMRVDMSSMLNGLPHLALQALAKMPRMTAEGTIWLTGMLSPNSSDLSVNLKVPDHISTRSMSNKLVKADVSLECPDPTWIGWNCMIIQLPSVDVAWLALAWETGTGGPVNVTGLQTNANVFNNALFTINSWGSALPDGTYRRLQSQPVGSIESTSSPNAGDQSICYFRQLEVGDVQYANMLRMPMLSNVSLAENYAEWRLAASGMTVLFQAPALSNQGTVYGVDAGRLHSQSHTADLILQKDGSYQPPAQDGTTLVINDSDYAVRAAGFQAWVDDYAPSTTFNQTDICRHEARLGSYTVLYPRKSEHNYMSVSDYGPLSFRAGLAISPSEYMPVIADTGSIKHILHARLDDAWGIKTVKYTGMSPQASLITKTVSHIEFVVDPRGSMNGLATTAFPYDAAAVDAALQLAATLPVMFPASDNDWGGFWRKVGGFLGSVPGWLNKRATPWVRNMGDAVSNLIQTGKDAGKNVASQF